MLRSENEVAASSGVSFRLVNRHCLSNILSLSQRREVIASSAIADECNATLWPAGAPLTPALQERLQGRRLRKPIEASVDVEDGVSMASAIGECEALIEQNRILAAFAGKSSVRDTLRGLRTLALPAPLRLLLTAARELRPHDHRVSLAAMIVAAGLALHAGCSERHAGELALAALVSDIGEAYIDPAYLDGARELRPGEWQHVAWHPCIGEALLREFARFPAAVSDGVLHHHERFGGYGYPFDVAGEQLGMLHTMLGVADTVAAIVMRGGAGLADRVTLALHIVPGEFPAPVVRLGAVPSD